MREATIAVRPLPTAARAAVVVGALWRLGVLLVDKWSQPLLLNDSLYYSAQARQLADGVWFREIFVDRPGAEHGPLTSTVLAVVSWAADPVPWQRLCTVLAGIATVWLLARLALRLAGPGAAVAAAWIGATYPNLWMNDGLVMSESFSVLTVVLVLHVALGALTDVAPDGDSPGTHGTGRVSLGARRCSGGWCSSASPPASRCSPAASWHSSRSGSSRSRRHGRRHDARPD